MVAVVIEPATKTVSTIENVSEQRILKKGLVELQRRLINPNDQSKLLEFPKRKNGTSLILQKAYLQNLLSDKIELQASLPSDVSAAQSDLKHLNLQQHLMIRSRTLDFQTSSASHETHNNFLECVDRYLFSDLAKHCLGLIANPLADLSNIPMLGSINSSSCINSVSFKLYSIGQRITHLLGAVAELQNDGIILPPCWAVQTDPVDWQGGCLALFHTEELWLRIFDAQISEVSALSKDAVNIIRDHSKGSGSIRQLNWEVVTVDPGDCDLIAEMGSAKASALHAELKAAVEDRPIGRVVASRRTKPASVSTLSSTPNHETEFSVARRDTQNAAEKLLPVAAEASPARKAESVVDASQDKDYSPGPSTADSTSALSRMPSDGTCFSSATTPCGEQEFSVGSSIARNDGQKEGKGPVANLMLVVLGFLAGRVCFCK